MTTLAGKKIWLVGASEGIGEAVARKLAAEGAQVCISARSADKIQALAAGLQGGNHLALPVDVTNDASVKQAWQALNARWGGIDMMIYNAGVYEPMFGTAFRLDEAERMMDVNFHGALRVLDCVLPVFVARKGGHIVLVASIAAYSGLPGAIGYGSSKAALLHLGENMGLDLRSSRIKVQVVSPGFVKTRMTDKNTFKMPFMVTPEFAADRIVRGLKGNGFEIHFPKSFTLQLKVLRMLPYRLYFAIMSKVG